MLDGKIVAVVVPAYNEESLIGVVIKTMPDFVDRIVVVNDCSKDKTEEIVKEYIKKDTYEVLELPWKNREMEENFFNKAEIIANKLLDEEDKYYIKHEIVNDNLKDRIVLINNEMNAKVGGGISVGYKWCRDHNVFCTAVMAGDAQMDPDELYDICYPIINEDIDYVKGNRLGHKAARILIPTTRRVGNSILSAMTKISSGYWRISDTQTGYTAISLRALNRIDIYNIYKNYGMPNDMLIKLNIAKCTIKEIAIKPVYNVGEQSKMNIIKVIPKISLLLYLGFWKRIIKKYCFKDFHPIFFFYLMGTGAFGGSLYFFFYMAGERPRILSTHIFF